MTQEEIEAELAKLRTDMTALQTWAAPVVESHAPNMPAGAKNPNSDVMPAYKMLLIEA